MKHTVQRGDTLWAIARQYGVSVAELVEANNITQPDRIYPGQTLVIPKLINFRSLSRRYGGFTAQIHIVRAPVSAEAKLVYNGPGPPFRLSTVSQLARGYDVAVNCSFFWAGYPLGRHISDGQKVYDYPGDRPTIVLDDWRLDTWYNGISRLLDAGVQNCLSAHPYLLYEGQPWISKHTPNLAARGPKTAIGRAGCELVLVVVDGRQPGYSHGITMTELSALMREEGCWEWAVNLDGGGSSTMAVGGQVVNRPSDGRERPVINALCFKL